MPIALAAGLGINGIVAFGLVLGSGLSLPGAMGVIVLEGIVVTILVLVAWAAVQRLRAQDAWSVRDLLIGQGDERVLLRASFWGYGGLLTAEALARNSDLFITGVDLAGVHLQGNSLDTAAVSYKSSSISQIAKWTSPVLLLQGSEDRVNAASDNADLLLPHLPDGRMKVLPGLGHLPEIEAPARVNAMLRAFYAV